MFEKKHSCSDLMKKNVSQYLKILHCDYIRIYIIKLQIVKLQVINKLIYILISRKQFVSRKKFCKKNLKN